MSGEGESDQIVQRRANLEGLKALGVDVYPHRFDAAATIGAVVAAHDADPADALEATHVHTRVAGRILGIRKFGKANFLVLSDGAARLQVYVRQDSVPELAFKIFKLLDFGDWVGVEGRLFRTKTNELTVWASSLTFLSKCLLPLPEKWHGLTDVETRYRQRYLDLAVNQPIAPGVRDAQPRHQRDPAVPAGARLSRGRDADDAADCGRRAGAPVQDASQRARHPALPPHCARALPQAAHRRRHRTSVRDQP